MRISKKQLRQIIKEELLREGGGSPQMKASGGGAEIFIPGLGTANEKGGAPVYLEFNGKSWELFVWSDISSEGPTHRIDLSKAVDNEAGNKELSENTGSSNQEEIDKILDLIENDPEFQILGQFKDKFLRYMQSGGDPLSALEAASPERRPVQKALEKLRTAIRPAGSKTPMGMPVSESKKQLKQIIKEELMRESGYKVGDPVKIASSGLEGKITELFPADGQWGETAVVSLSSGEEAEFELTDLEPDLDAADRKAAEEILSTRMGSYKGTTLPGGKKIK